MEQLTESLLTWALPLAIVAAVSTLFAWLLSRLLPADAENSLPRQLAFVILGLLVPVALILALPLESETRGQLLSLFGLVVTAIIALASTSTVSNVMAGLTLRGMNNFRLGDFVHVNEYFGRVTERGLMHTEIQSEDRDLITLPNVYLAQNPVKVVRSSGTLISTDVSIGYDVHRVKVTDALLVAAADAELRDAFVQITELGSFAIHYRVSGFLSDVSSLVSKRTQLRAKAIDALHAAGIEIMTPNVMAQRPLHSEAALLPPAHYGAEPTPTQAAEQLMFDKAEVAARIDKFNADKLRLEGEIAELSDDPDGNEHRIRWRQRQIEALDEMLSTLHQGHDA